MQTYIRPFQVVQESSQTLAVTETSQSLTLPAARNGNCSIRIVVVGTQTVFWSFDGSARTATSTPVAAGFVETFFLPKDVSTIEFIAETVGSTVYITLGESA